MCSLQEHIEREIRERESQRLIITERPAHPVYIPEHMRATVREVQKP